ncbi:MAG: Rossmann-like domain-containing protein [Haloplanus sp.]
MTASIPAQVDRRLRDRGATVDRITVGDATVLVELVDDEAGHIAGLAHRPPGVTPTTDGVGVARLSSWASGTGADPVHRALGFAALNALSAPHVEWRTGDPMALLDPSVDRVTTVGLFGPALRKFADVTVRVIERDPVGDVSAPAGVRVETFTPDATATAMAGAEVVFLTGSAFVYGGAEAYLDATPPSATLVVVGATTSFLPGPLFEAGADAVAGATIDDAERVRTAVRTGACGTDLHDAGVRKGYVTADRADDVRFDTIDEADT